MKIRLIPDTRIFAIAVLTASATALALSGCNIFSSLDKPSGDAQFLSKARACFDAGDIPCARENYGKVSSAQAEVASSELAFAILDENGITMGAFMDAMAEGKGPDGLNKLAGHLAGLSPGKAKRQAIYSAYRKIDDITNDMELKGLVRFMTAFALAAEILSEDAILNDPNKLEQKDLVTDPATCNLTSAYAGCAPPPGGKIVLGTKYTLATDSATISNAIDGGPTLGLLNWCFLAINQAFSPAELGAGGKFGSGTGGMSSSMTDSGQVPFTEITYRGGLLNQGIGQ